MVQKSGDCNQLRLVVYPCLYHYLQGLCISQVVQDFIHPAVSFETRQHYDLNEQLRSTLSQSARRHVRGHIFVKSLNLGANGYFCSLNPVLEGRINIGRVQRHCQRGLEISSPFKPPSKPNSLRSLNGFPPFMIQCF